MNGDLWLAVGDETGRWDDTEPSKRFLGVALVMAKISNWKSALRENFKGQTIEQRMKQPLQFLPEQYLKQDSDYNVHHVYPTFEFFRREQVQGIWSLDETVAEKTPVDCLRNELCANLGWLAKHRNLITVGAYGKSDWVWGHLTSADDPAQALGRAYALLATLVIPFLNNKDTLLVAPGLRSENSKAWERVISSSSEDNEAKRLKGHIRGITSTLLDYTKPALRTWHGVSQEVDSATFLILRENYSSLNKFLDKSDMYALNGIADMGTALMALSQNPKNIHLHDPNQNWHNVTFFKFEELWS